MWDKLLVSLFLGLLQLFLARQDLFARARAEAKDEATQRALDALAIKAELAARPDAGGELRVRPGAPGVPRVDAGPGDAPPAPGA